MSAKLKTLRAGKTLQKGCLLGHYTSTLAGMAAGAQSQRGLLSLQRFKRRKSPFLLLADSVSTALQQAVYLTPALRAMAKQSWPGAVTLVFPAVKNLHPACYQQGKVAVRVDGDVETRRLAKMCGGLLLSSSFNRKGRAVQAVDMRVRYRWRRHLGAILSAQAVTSGQASTIFRLSAGKVHRLR
ncbi:MAG: Sua5/YciO/YrdC/YwlC family protein [Mariprofundaceae bacterium]|nr:Sua5/YciO/YrdC/YwlC family protein [Mariprofundaceae bacterium]